jgi:hypothetical protein
VDVVDIMGEGLAADSVAEVSGVVLAGEEVVVEDHLAAFSLI